MVKKILVWDVPTRVFHWLLVTSFAGAYLTSESERNRDIHAVLGFTVLGLLIFRLMWGFVGSRYARFGSFIFKPSELFAYLKSLLQGKAIHYVGHNPAGGLAIFGLIGLGLTITVSGVFVFQDMGGDALEELHEMATDLMLGLVGIHLAGVVVSSKLHHENLARAMVTGKKDGEEEAGISNGYLWVGLMLLVIVLAFWLGYKQTGWFTA